MRSADPGRNRDRTLICSPTTSELASAPAGTPCPSVRILAANVPFTLFMVGGTVANATAGSTLGAQRFTEAGRGRLRPKPGGPGDATKSPQRRVAARAAGAGQAARWRTSWSRSSWLISR